MQRGDSPLDAMKKTETIAKRKSVANKEFTPVRLILKEDKNCLIKTCDIFKMQTMSDARGRDRADLSISRCIETNYRDHVAFEADKEEGYCWCVIPKTDHNMKLLATHWDELWDIDDPVVNEEAHKKYEEILRELAAKGEPIRDTRAAHSQVTQQQAHMIQQKVIAERKESLKSDLGVQQAQAAMKLDRKTARSLASTWLDQNAPEKIVAFKAMGKGYQLAPEYQKMLDNTIATSMPWITVEEDKDAVNSRADKSAPEAGSRVGSVRGLTGS